jgi:hypothetical protein
LFLLLSLLNGFDLLGFSLLAEAANHVGPCLGNKQAEHEWNQEDYGEENALNLCCRVVDHEVLRNTFYMVIGVDWDK